MIFEQMPISGDRNFAYLLGDLKSREAALIDPGSDGEALVGRVRHHGLKLVWIIHTHGHFDHTGDTETVVRLTSAPLAAYARGSHPLKDGDRLSLGRHEIRVLHTPGHTEDSICLLCAGKLITGDTLFVGKIGGTPDRDAAQIEYDSLQRQICTLPPETEVWPGHDYGVRPASTIGDELKENPFLLRRNFEEFWDLKQNWTEYKRVHGIK